MNEFSEESVPFGDATESALQLATESRMIIGLTHCGNPECPEANISAYVQNVGPTLTREAVLWGIDRLRAEVETGRFDELLGSD